MQVESSSLITKVRIALDDILPTGSVDSFGTDVNTEIRQALLQAAEEVVMNAPADLLEPTVYASGDAAGVTAQNYNTPDDGVGIIYLPNDTTNGTFLRLLELQMDGWAGILTELVEPSTDEARMQRSKWSRGCPEKPKAMLTYEKKTVTLNDNTTTTIHPCLLFWTANYKNNAYDYTIKHLTYAKAPVLTTDTDPILKCDAKNSLEKNIIFTACRIFLTGKKETALADKFAELASIY